MAIEFYKEFGRYGYLANYSEYGFYKNGIFYKTVEHYYQSEKYDNEEIKNKIINAKDAHEAAKIGRDRNNIRKDNFKKIKLDVMFEGVLEKFRQNKDILHKLIETRNEIIIEKTEDEYFWGIGKDNSGENQFGKILMKARDILKREILDRIIDNCKKEKDVYILGHNNPDCDSMFSSILLKNILSSMGINAHFCILDKNYDLASCDKKIIEEYIPEYPEVISDTTNKKFILVDHNTLDGIPKENVIGAFDHHIISNEVDDLIEIEISSTGLLLYDLFRDRYNFYGPNSLYVGLTVLCDTNYLCSTRFSKEDEELFNSLKLNINVKYFRKNYFQTTDLSKGIDFVIKNCIKNYNYNGNNINRIVVDTYNKEYYELFDEYASYVSKLNGNWLLMWCNYEDMITKVWYKGNIYTYDKLITSTYMIFQDLESKGKIKKLTI